MYLICNLAIISAGLQLCIPSGLGHEWLHHIGEMRFRIFCFLAAPIVAFFAGIGAMIIAKTVINAGNR
jgi:hypothetical protein